MPVLRSIIIGSLHHAENQRHAGDQLHQQHIDLARGQCHVVDQRRARDQPHLHRGQRHPGVQRPRREDNLWSIIAHDGRPEYQHRARDQRHLPRGLHHARNLCHFGNQRHIRDQRHAGDQLHQQHVDLPRGQRHVVDQRCVGDQRYPGGQRPRREDDLWSIIAHDGRPEYQRHAGDQCHLPKGLHHVENQRQIGDQHHLLGVQHPRREDDLWSIIAHDGRPEYQRHAKDQRHVPRGLRHARDQ